LISGVFLEKLTNRYLDLKWDLIALEDGVSEPDLVKNDGNESPSFFD